ncbi:helix-turn-helix domain-containing protein [Lentzea cavernae]|uniref:AraC family transcriptional regulator n=1 Tax=Lentzea cavernae TaxID=2020703 RepID=A0ABQ3MJ73_9PSEU|nr:helix-turn-helix transcriptional regulator [Lentzea cavernae]GHH49080.1 AraC family transcriptional regulator [Lentzea cavernae]
MEERVEVPADLRAWISGISVATAGDERTVLAEPDHATTLVLRVVPDHGSELVVEGPRTRARYHRSDPGPWCVRARIHTGRVRSLLGRPAHELVDRVVPLGEFPGGHEDPRRDELLREATALLAGGSVAAVARELHVSERHLRTLFLDGVGVSPKHFARIDRLRAVLAQDRPWAEVAAGTGFYDQAHLTGEFRRLMGVSPAAFRRGDLPAALPCHAKGPGA